MGPPKLSLASSVISHRRPRAPKNCGDWPCFVGGCEKKLTRKADVFRHLQVHWPETIHNHPCSICPYSTRQAVNLKNHLSRHAKRTGSPVIHDSELMNFPRSMFTSKDPFAIKFKNRITKKIREAKEVYDRLIATMAVPQANCCSSSSTPSYDPHRTISEPLTNPPPHIDSFHSLSSTPTSYDPEIATYVSPTSPPPHLDPLISTSLLMPTYPSHVAESASLPTTTPLQNQVPLVPTTTRISQSEPPSLAVSGASTFDPGGYPRLSIPAPSFQAIGEPVDAATLQANTYYQLNCQTTMRIDPGYFSYEGYEPAPQQMFGVPYIPNPQPHYSIYSSTPTSYSSSLYYPNIPNMVESRPSISTYQYTSSQGQVSYYYD